MNKIKAGDIVRILDNSEHPYLTKDKLAIVERIDKDDTGEELLVKELEEPVGNQSWFVSITSVEKVESVERNYKFNIGDIVKVVNDGHIYPIYREWFKENGCEDLLDFFTDDEPFEDELDYQIVAKGIHECDDVNIYAITPIGFDSVFLIGERGLKLKEVEEPKQEPEQKVISISGFMKKGSVRLENIVEFKTINNTKVIVKLKSGFIVTYIGEINIKNVDLYNSTISFDFDNLTTYSIVKE